MEKKHYGCIDGLRTIAAVGILMMHIKTNNEYQLSGFFYETVISSFTNFVFLFMIVSAFGMCMGYYDKVLTNKISMSEFYEKRFKKILPFFGLMVLIDVMHAPSIDAIYEGFTDLTLMFGFLPNAGNITVIGVGWFLGLIFVFYLCFPFFCFLIENKKRAWITFGISIALNFVSVNYFHVKRQNILYSACYFLAGGLIYLYRDQIIKINKWIVFAVLAVAVHLYYSGGAGSMSCLLISASLLIYAVISEGGILENRITKFISGISMEIYLSHMAIFRIVEKLRLNTRFGNGWVQYFITFFIVLGGTIVFSMVMKLVINTVECKLKIKHLKKTETT